jgi:hypothetical protein
MAENLEKAAKAGDLAYVTANNPAFIETVIKLAADIDNALARYVDQDDQKKDRPKKEKPYKEALLNLLAACEQFKTDDIDAAINEIECFEYTSDDGLVLWLRENIDQMNFTEIAEKISGLV